MRTKRTRMRNLCALFCAFVLLTVLLLPSGVSATGNGQPQHISADTQTTMVMDTTAMTQQEYLQKLQKASAKLNAADAVQPTCELFISAVFAAKRDSSYDCTAFGAKSLGLDATIAYLNSAAEYQRLVRQAFDLRVLSDELTFDRFRATITGDTCTAEIGVHYCYEVTGRFEETCYLNCMYYLELVYEDGWKIASATSSMPGEQDEDFAYGAFDADVAAQQLIEAENQACATVVEAAPPKMVPQGSAMTRVHYSTVAAVDYAEINAAEERVLNQGVQHEPT